MLDTDNNNTSNSNDNKNYSIGNGNDICIELYKVLENIFTLSFYALSVDHIQKIENLNHD